VFIRVNLWFLPAQKTLKKVQKKTCQPLTRSAKQGLNATSGSRRPFKKTLKKVKKKLVSAIDV
jgi:hypothetical protein